MKWLKILGWIVIPYIMILFVWKRSGVLKRTVGVLWALFILILTVTPKETAVKPVTATAPAAVEVGQAEPAESKSLVSAVPAEVKKGKPAAKKESPKEPTAAEWQASHKKIILNEAQSYIELSVQQTLSKERYDSAVDVIQTYTDKIDDADKASFQKLSTAVEADELENAKKVYTSLGGEPFPELKAADPTPIKKEPVSSQAPNPTKKSEPASVAPVVETEPQAAPVQEVSFKNCDAVRAAGAAPIYAEDPGYSSKLDRDGDGVGCEK